MNGTKSGSRGFTLIASLLLLLLMTGISIGLLMMVQTEGRAGANDVENSLAYRGAEGAIENMTSSLAGAFPEHPGSPGQRHYQPELASAQYSGNHLPRRRLYL